MRNDAERMMDLARRALAHYQAKTTDQADEIMAQPVAAYSDPERYARETERIFKRLPLALALSLELPEPGSCLALEMLGIPVVMIRGTDGRARAFLNACRHRGAPVCPPGRGQGKSFTCPYHAWSYDTRGRSLIAATASANRIYGGKARRKAPSPQSALPGAHGDGQTDGILARIPSTVKCPWKKKMADDPFILSCPSVLWCLADCRCLVACSVLP